MRHLFAPIAILSVVACSSYGPSGGGGGYPTGTGGTTSGSSGGTPSGSAGSGTPSSSGTPAATNGGAPSSGGSASDAGAWAGGGDDSGSASDSGWSAPDTGVTAPSAPTWSQIYADYLSSGTMGHCVDCHGQASSAGGTYAFLKGAGYINGAQSSMSGVFTWMGGFMPPGGSGSNAKASSDIQAWVAAGALDD